MASTPWSPSPAEPSVPQAAAMNLRPLSLGELLDRAFSVYRSHFPLFAGITAVPALAQLLLASVQLSVMHVLRKHVTLGTVTLVTLILGYALALLVFLAFSVAHAAVVQALSETYMGRPATVAGSLRAAVSHTFRYIGIALWQFFAAAGVWILCAVPGFVLILRLNTHPSVVEGVIGGALLAVGGLAGIPLGIFLYLRNALAVPASVQEALPVRAAMRRSKQLAAGAKGRIFVLLLLAWGLWFVVGMLQMPMAIVVMRATMRQQEALWAQAVNLLVGFFGVSVVTPVPAIGMALIYFDQRVRKEAWDLELLLGVPAPAAVVPDQELPPPPAAAVIPAPGDGPTDAV